MMINKKYSLIAASLLVALTGCSDDDSSSEPVAPTADFSLTVAHVNDTHSNFDPTSVDFTAPITDEGMSLRVDAGGYARMAEKLEMARATAEAADQPFLALHGGDAFQGSLYFNVMKGQGNAQLLSMMGLDAMAIGNHEFDLGNEALIDFANRVNFPLLAANMDTSGDSAMSKIDNIMPYTVKSLNGQNVGIFGLVLEDMESISSPGEDLAFEGEVVSAQATVNALLAEGVDHIVMVSHIGTDRDLRIAEEVNGVDLIVGGHSHTLLGDFTNLGMGHGHPDMDYAEMVTNPDGGKTCIVQAGQYAQAVGQVTVEFAQGDILTCAGNNTLLIDDNFAHKYDGENREPLTDADQASAVEFIDGEQNIAITEQDVQVQYVIDEDFKPLVEEFEGLVIGDIFDENDPVDQGSLDHTRIPGLAKYDASLRYKGSEAGVHVADSMVWKLNEVNMDVDFAITNNGGIRNPIVAGDEGLTAGYIIGELLYFSNELAVVELLGSDVRDLLNDTIGYALDPLGSSGSFPTFANIQFTYNGLSTEDNKIESLQVCPTGAGNADCTDIIDDTVYRIATNAYIAGGKDGYDIFAERAQSEMVASGFIDNESMIEYVEYLTEQGMRLEEKPTGLNFIEPADFVADSPLKKEND
ncbi:bifunctional metallophosphatase/5'-nucleotidase [Ferrimonas lipolytica]|uniref:Bifunctional metallophosphatase/5'-nucleotidase n=1 Tax=Ferrimonas lipolytica TaxID=2724191 RepID=A0A6H1UER8_9GAMM|nr:5'-nucleotidase C-terminal domain-containing protein [Ferrimonas lipolytica]QIZ77090.1 bifunctional metallophosphatase/5'-nucleotidase [Ferrimonas lipolytica]